MILYEASNEWNVELILSLILSFQWQQLLFNFLSFSVSLYVYMFPLFFCISSLYKYMSTFLISSSLKRSHGMAIKHHPLSSATDANKKIEQKIEQSSRNKLVEIEHFNNLLIEAGKFYSSSSVQRLKSSSVGHGQCLWLLQFKEEVHKTCPPENGNRTSNVPTIQLIDSHSSTPFLLFKIQTTLSPCLYLLFV